MFGRAGEPDFWKPRTRVLCCFANAANCFGTLGAKGGGRPELFFLRPKGAGWLSDRTTLRADPVTGSDDGRVAAVCTCAQ